ncbi:MAG: hypothetical protein DRR19_25935 [Candidatus Parabeggiatoa sp. nov. 1]|nr:MAG: hypothetical protein DRR19_25935 [Gammaproteobacteria bacterium]
MSISNSKTMKTSVLSVTALAASSVWGKGGGPRLGVDLLTLDTLPVKNTTLCLPARQATRFGGLMPNTQSVVVDSMVKSFKVSFIVSELTAIEEDRVLFLVYSPSTSPSPGIITTDKGPELGLDMDELEMLGVYSLPTLFKAEQPETKVGLADASPTSKITVHVNFDTDKLNDMMRRGKETIYIQAAMIRVSELNNGLLENMILSEMDTLTFVSHECPAGTVESYEADDSGGIGKSSR